MNKLDLKHRQVVTWLDEHYAFFLTHVLRLGTPTLNPKIEKASMALKEDVESGEFSLQFEFNPEFHSQASIEELAFVYSHEAMHLLLEHQKLLGKTFNLKLRQKLQAPNQKVNKEAKKWLAESERLISLWDIAADCVINDYLVDSGFPRFENARYGQENVGFNCSRSSVTEVFEELVALQKPGPETKSKNSSKSDQSKSSKGKQSSGSTGGEEQEEAQGEAQGEAIDDHEWLNAFKKRMKEAEIQEAIDEIRQIIQNELPQAVEDLKNEEEMQTPLGRLAGTGHGALQDFIDNNKVSFAWAELLREVDPDLFEEPGKGPEPRPSFHRRRRKLGAFPQINLPVSRVDERHVGQSPKKPIIVMALDTSGSIESTDRTRFLRLAKSIPQDRIRLAAITFTEAYQRLDLDNVQYASGGTNFSCIQEFIQEKVVNELGAYPKAVVVITDGHASFRPPYEPSSQEIKSWFWLLTDDGNALVPSRYGRFKRLREFLL